MQGEGGYSLPSGPSTQPRPINLHPDHRLLFLLGIGCRIRHFRLNPTQSESPYPRCVLRTPKPQDVLHRDRIGNLATATATEKCWEDLEAEITTLELGRNDVQLSRCSKKRRGRGAQRLLKRHEEEGCRCRCRRRRKFVEMLADVHLRTSLHVYSKINQRDSPDEMANMRTHLVSLIKRQIPHLDPEDAISGPLPALLLSFIKQPAATHPPNCCRPPVRPERFPNVLHASDTFRAAEQVILAQRRRHGDISVGGSAGEGSV